MLSVSLMRLYFRIRSLAVLEVSDGEAFTWRRGGTGYTGYKVGHRDTSTNIVHADWS